MLASFRARIINVIINVISIISVIINASYAPKIQLINRLGLIGC